MVNSASTLALLAAANCSGVAYMFNLQKLVTKTSGNLSVQSPRNHEDIALQQFEFYAQLTACQALF
jgi:hypothetical protein